MENNIDILNNIMKPYFDKKAEIEGVPAALEEEKEELRLKVKDLKGERIEKRRALEKEYEEIESKIAELQNKRIEERKALEIELENLRVRAKISINDFKERKDREIEEYISKAMNSNQNLSAAYGSFVRKDLEKQYEEQLNNLQNNFKEQEKELIEKINALEKESVVEINHKARLEQLIVEIKELRVVSEDERVEKQNIENLDNKSDFSRVDLRELVEIKDDIRKKLFAERKRLNSKLLELKSEQELYEKISSELKENRLKFNEIMDKLSNFKYEYNDQNQVINSDEWRELYEESNLVSQKIQDLTMILSEKVSVIHELNDVNKSLEKVEENIKLTELTKEEISSIMMSMTPWEKAEYDRRKGKINSNEDMIEINDPVVSNYEVVDDTVVTDDKANLLKTIYNDIVHEVKRLRSVKLNPSKGKLEKKQLYISTKETDTDYKLNGIVDLSGEETLKLPCGEYVNLSDINEAVANLFNKNKGTTYIVQETGKEYRISKTTLEKFKSKLKKCSTIKLLKEKKISKLDLFRVFGKERSEDIAKETEIGTLDNINLPEGDYVSRNELIASLDNLFATKKLEWLRSLSDKLRAKGEEVIEKLQQKALEKEFYIIETDNEQQTKQK